MSTLASVCLVPTDNRNAVPCHELDGERITYIDGTANPVADDWITKGESNSGAWWTGRTVFSLAAKKNPSTHRNKSTAKKAAREQRFTNMDNLMCPKASA